MLVITRKMPAEKSKILETDIDIFCPDGSRITVVLNKIQGTQARIGIIAPDDYRISRVDTDREFKEVFKAEIKKEKESKRRNKMAGLVGMISK